MMQDVKKQQKTVEINLFTIVQLLWKRKWLVLTSGVVVAFVFLMATLIFVRPKYSANVMLYANNSSSTNINTSITSSDLTASVKLVDTYAAIILSDPVLDRVIEMNGLNTTSRQLSGAIKVASVNNTEVFRVTVEYTSPEMAADIANTIADIAPGKIGNIVEGCSVKVVSNAKVPTTKSYPSNKLAVLVGMLLGVAMCSLVIIVISMLDTRIKNQSDLQSWEYPVLGVIPSFIDAEQVSAYGYGYGKKGVK